MLDFEDEAVHDCTYTFTLNENELTIKGEDGTVGGTYRLTKEQIIDFAPLFKEDGGAIHFSCFRKYRQLYYKRNLLICTGGMLNKQRKTADIQRMFGKNADEFDL